MTEYVQFFTAHWLLSIALVVVLIAFIVNETRNQLSANLRCSPQQLVQMMNHDNATVVDIREKADYRAGKIVGSKNISADDLVKKSPDFDKATPLVLVCSNGMQSEKLAQTLKQQGFNAYYLNGGLTSWKNDNMPISRN